MKSILRKVTVTDVEEEWPEHKASNKVRWLFNMAVTKIQPEVDSPDFGFSGNCSIYLTLQQRHIHEKDGITYFPFRVVVRDDGRSLVSFVNIEPAEKYLKKHLKDIID